VSLPAPPPAGSGTPRRGVRAAVAGLRRALEAVLVILSAAYAVIVLLQVFFRYVLNDSLVWAEELIRYALVWAIMLGSAVVAARGEDIRLDTLPLALGPRGRRALLLAADAATLVFCALLVWYGTVFMLRAGGQRASASGLPMAFAYAAMPVGGVLIAIFVVAHRWGAGATDPGRAPALAADDRGAP
jgi:C4-dicarboxylate transporter DctQ subunit